MGLTREKLAILFLTWVVYLWLALLGSNGARAQVSSWTPIFMDAKNRKDLWTVSETGCDCPRGSRSKSCACCIKPGGCLCSSNQNKCGQCGLEDSCQRFCNVSISSRTVATRSGLSWVELKSPVLDGPTACWWRLESAPGQRIEVQIHRLVAVGNFDNSSQRCKNGFLQFSDGDGGSSIPSQSIQLCAQNSRFFPPVVLFGDQGIATLLLSIDGKSIGSQLLSYVSFSSADDPTVGDPSKGGRIRSSHSGSGCDLTFENCWQENSCVFSSPSFPGLFPPHRRCRFYINSNSTTDRIRLRFHSLSLPPPPLCSGTHVAIWKRNNSSTNILGLPWKTLCEELQSTVDIEGGQAIVEFRSGATTPPYLYNGFKASILFIPSVVSPAVRGPTVIPTTPRSPYLPPLSGGYERRPGGFQKPFQESRNHGGGIENTEAPLGNPRASYEGGNVFPIDCGHVFDGDDTRGTVFRLTIPRELSFPSSRVVRGFGMGSYGASGPPNLPPPGPFRCLLEFRGKEADVVQLAIFNYKFRGSNCSTYMDAYDVGEEASNRTNRLLGRLCGPLGYEVKRFTSSHNRISLTAFIFPHDEAVGSEFLEGAFRFHDEAIEGTVKPQSSCEVVYYGVTSSPRGFVVGPPDSPLLRLATFPLVCAHSFLPSTNQSVSLTLTRAGHDKAIVAVPGSKTYCRSFCAGSGCRCEAKYTPLDEIDHLLLIAGSTPIGCLCGYFPDALPITFESHTPLTLVYHATKGGREFSYSASFHFKAKVTCANLTIEPPSGYKRWREILGNGMISNRSSNHYAYFQCVWPISIPHRYQLTLDFKSEEAEKDCNTWNITLWARGEKRSQDSLLYSFCPDHGSKEVKVPDTVQNAFIKFAGVTLRSPHFEIRWRYIDVIGSGLLSEKKLTNGGSNQGDWSSEVKLIAWSAFLLFLTA